jgi:hypothetical protein
MEEMIANSDKWNLAGDVALLNTLKAFADNLLTRTTEINNNLQNLTDSLNETHLELNIAQNKFQSLRNTQFIESRVYEDDETLPQSENESKTKPQEEVEPDRTEDIRLAALKGLEVLDQYFDKVEVSVSDSEDEDIDLPNYVLRPKDLYIDRPLPYVIGSEEWHKNWHVGLEDSSSDSETEKVSDQFSESDSESDLPIIQDRSQIKGTSDTSSELDFSQKAEPIKSNKPEIFNSSDSENSVPVQAPISNKNFAEQLAAKLGHVITQDFTEPEVNKRPIQPKSNYGDIFFDEPPPLDEGKGLFSGGSGLFDDDDEEGPSDWTPKDSKVESPKLPTTKSGGLFDSDDDIFGAKKTPVPKPPLFTEEPPVLEEKKKPIGGVSIFGGGNLFDKKLLKRRPSSDDEEHEEKNEPIKEEKPSKKVDLFGDDDLFKSVPNEDKSVVKKEKNVKKINLFDSDEEESESSSLFGGDQKKQNEKQKNVLFDDNVTEKQESRDEKKVSSVLFADEVPSKEDKPKSEKKISLFDDDDDLFKDDLFSTSSTKKFTSGLFDDIPEDDLFASNFEDKPQPAGNLVEDLMAIPDNKNSINVDTKAETKETTSYANLDANPGESSQEINSTTDNLFTSSPLTDDIFGRTENDSKEPEPPQPKPRLSLFDSPPPEPDDLFGGSYKTSKSDDVPSDIFESSNNLFENSPKTDLFASSEKIEARASSMRLFDSSPPPDDEWDTKSDNLSDRDDFVNDFEETTSNKASLFNDEPPSLETSEETSTKSKPGKLKHNLNINVGALMPGSVRPKRVDTSPKKSSESPTETPRVSFEIPKVSPETTTTTAETSPTSFDDSDGVKVLHSVTKDRARVPLRRRPSTRKGRKAALRNSGADFKLEQDEEEADSRQSPDLVTSSKTGDLFEEKQAKPKTSQPVISLFDDENDDDDLFSKKVPVQTTKVLKKSLFDDDEDDDIFKSFSTASAKKPDTKVATEKKLPKVSTIKKLENTKPEDDPLSALLK